MGAHQRIDRIARRHLKKHVPRGLQFPTIRQILHFEGLNGPDGIKRKSPGVDEPWHFIDPYHEGDHAFFDLLDDHIYNLATALREDNPERAAFEASWLAHAVVDGLTPAHHYPFEEKLEELRGEGIETRTSKRSKMLMPGKSRRHQLKNNWEFWGSKGLMTTHLAFEFGVATTISTARFETTELDEDDIKLLEEKGYEHAFRQILREVADMKMYEEFTAKGWTRHLAKETRDTLAPLIIKAVVLSWVAAVRKAS
jgi:hypothetical protein